jgi:hypothetical protein
MKIPKALFNVCQDAFILMRARPDNPIPAKVLGGVSEILGGREEGLLLDLKNLILTLEKSGEDVSLFQRNLNGKPLEYPFSLNLVSLWKAVKYRLISFLRASHGSSEVDQKRGTFLASVCSAAKEVSASGNSEFVREYADLMHNAPELVRDGRNLSVLPVDSFLKKWGDRFSETTKQALSTKA